MISHVTIAVRDFDRALGFYQKVLGQIGLIQSYDDPNKPAASFRRPEAPRPLFFLVAPYDGGTADPGNGPMVAFHCLDREEVDRVYAQAIELGATDEGGPGLRPHYHENYYGAYIRDPEGNKVCFVCHDPAWVKPA